MLSAEAAIMKVKSRKIGFAGLGFPLSEGNYGVTGIDNPFSMVRGSSKIRWRRFKANEKIF